MSMGRTRIEPLPPTAAAERRRFLRGTGPRRSPGVHDGVSASHPWWLWPHLLSLDAPLVALAWQDWWGAARHSPPNPGQRVVLGLGVWLIYLADRLADAARGSSDELATARHAFARNRTMSLLILSAGVVVALVVVTPRTLPVGEFHAGLVFLAAATTYFWLIHRRSSSRWTARLPKEAVVGAMFALGTAFFALCGPSVPARSLVMAIVLFGVVCFLNCALITSWERNACDLRDPFSFLNTFPRFAAGGLRSACWLLAALAISAALALHSTVYLPVAFGAILLGLLDRWRHRFSPDALRSLADVVLLAPWICRAVAGMFE